MDGMVYMVLDGAVLGGLVWYGMVVHKNTPGTAGGPGGRDQKLNDGNNNGQAPHGARKLPRSKTFHISLVVSNSSNIDKCKLSQKV